MATDLLEAISRRFTAYAEGGRRDHWLVLSDEASREAQELWKREASIDGSVPMPARQALAWFHWARYYALPQGHDLNDLQAALVLFSPIFLMAPDEVPEEVKDFLEQNKASAVLDNQGVAAQSDQSYTSRTYPNAVDYVRKLELKRTEEPADRLLRDVLQSVHGAEWEEKFGTALTVKRNGVGIFISDIPGETDISIAAGVLSGMQLSEDLVKVVADVNRSTKIGGLYLTKGQAEWLLVFKCGIMKRWIDSNSPESRRMLSDILSAIPELVKARAAHVAERIQPCAPWPPLVDGWEMLILSHM